jgi:hypothetical protein
MAAPAPAQPDLTLGALEGAALTTAATEGFYLVSVAAGTTPFSYLMVLGLALVSFAGYLGYKAYKAA